MILLLLLFVLVVMMFSPIYFWRMDLVGILSPAKSWLADLYVAVSELKGAPGKSMFLMAICIVLCPAVLKRGKFGAL